MLRRLLCIDMGSEELEPNIVHEILFHMKRRQGTTQNNGVFIASKK